MKVLSYHYAMLYRTNPKSGLQYATLCKILKVVTENKGVKMVIETIKKVQTI